MNALTAAHRRLPLGTRIRVTNLENNRVVELLVNDRGPYVRRRILDVSQRAARQLGFVDDGRATVRIEIIEPC
jgi:rare lipoprotein A